MAQASLEPCWVKVHRAQAHFDVLDAEVRSFLRTKPYFVSMKREPEINGVVVCAEALQKPPATWSVVIGDCVHNLRTALDYLVWQLVKANDGTLTYREEFPVFTNSRDYAQNTSSKIGGVSDLAAERIESLQPYSGRNDWRQDLVTLHDLDRFDKHRALQVTGFVLSGFRMATATSNGNATPEYLVPSGPFEDGQPIGRVAFTPIGPDAKLEVRPEASFDIAFDEPDSAATGLLVVPALIACTNAARRVLRAFADLLP